jgi:hypothetical protein
VPKEREVSSQNYETFHKVMQRKCKTKTWNVAIFRNFGCATPCPSAKRMCDALAASICVDFQSNKLGFSFINKTTITISASEIISRQ